MVDVMKILLTYTPRTATGFNTDIKRSLHFK